MEKHFSQKLGLWFWITDVVTIETKDGLPIFSKQELREMKDKGITIEQLKLAYNLRLECNEGKETPRQDIGYKEKAPDTETIRRKEITQKWSKAICDKIKETEIRSIPKAFKKKEKITEENIDNLEKPSDPTYTDGDLRTKIQKPEGEP